MKITEKDLRNQILLDELTATDRRKLLKLIQPLECTAGDVVFAEGAATDGIYLIHKGRVEISKSTADGWQQPIATLTRGHFFGELSVIEDRKKHSAQALARTSSVLLLIPAAAFRAVEKTEPLIMARLMRTIARVASRDVHAMNEKLMKLLISY